MILAPWRLHPPHPQDIAAHTARFSRALCLVDRAWCSPPEPPTIVPIHNALLALRNARWLPLTDEGLPLDWVDLPPLEFGTKPISPVQLRALTALAYVYARGHWPAWSPEDTTCDGWAPHVERVLRGSDEEQGAALWEMPHVIRAVAMCMGLVTREGVDPLKAERLAAEVARLRALCLEHGVDPNAPLPSETGAPQLPLVQRDITRAKALASRFARIAGLYGKATVLFTLGQRARANRLLRAAVALRDAPLDLNAEPSAPAVPSDGETSTSAESESPPPTVPVPVRRENAALFAHVHARLLSFGVPVDFASEIARAILPTPSGDLRALDPCEHEHLRRLLSAATWGDAADRLDDLAAQATRESAAQPDRSRADYCDGTAHGLSAAATLMREGRL